MKVHLSTHKLNSQWSNVALNPFCHPRLSSRLLSRLLSGARPTRRAFGSGLTIIAYNHREWGRVMMTSVEESKKYKSKHRDNCSWRSPWNILCVCLADDDPLQNTSPTSLGEKKLESHKGPPKIIRVLGQHRKIWLCPKSKTCSPPETHSEIFLSPTTFFKFQKNTFKIRNSN